MPNLILASSFHTVADKLLAEGLIPSSGASVAFVPTAGDPYVERPWLVAERAALVRLGYRVVDVDLKEKTAEILRRELAGFDVVFVVGGNTTYLAEHARRSGFGDVVRDLLRDGALYVGSSAGAILAGPTVEPFAREDAAELPPGFVAENPECLRLVDYVVLPHDNVPEFAKEHDVIIEANAGRRRFVRMTDGEYRAESIE